MRRRHKLRWQNPRSNSASDVRIKRQVRVGRPSRAITRKRKSRIRRNDINSRAHHDTKDRTIAVPIGGGGTSTLNRHFAGQYTSRLPSGNDGLDERSQLRSRTRERCRKLTSLLCYERSDTATERSDVNLVDMFDHKRARVENNRATRREHTFTATVAIDPAQVPTAAHRSPTGTVTSSDGIDIPGCVNVALNGAAQAHCSTFA